MLVNICRNILYFLYFSLFTLGSNLLDVYVHMYTYQCNRF